nr:reverse transcriptase domain-containing protein [Tanacetum cinerariifolium]
MQRTTNLRNEISNFQQRFDESFHEAWDQYKDLLRVCPHHGCTELHQLDTFYNALIPADQDSLNYAAGVKSSDANSSSSSEIAKLTHAVNQQTSAVTTTMTAILKQFQATPPSASVKAVEEIYVTCGGAHPYYQCLAADGNTFLELQDNIQGYVSAAAVNYSQELKKMMASFFQMNTASTSGPGPLPSNTIANPKGELKAITTQSGIVLDGPFVPIPPPFIHPEEDERVEEKLTDQDLAGIARDVFVLVGKFTFPTDFVIVDYENDPRVPLILGRPFLRTAHALIDVHEEEMILRNGDERLTLNMRHDTSSYSNQPQKELIKMINIFNDSCEDFLEDLFAINHQSGSPTFSSHSNLTSPEVKDIFDPEGDMEFADELALITFPPRNDNLLFDIESDLADLNDNLVDTMPEMFTDEHALDYSSPPLYDEYDDDIFEVESNTKYAYNDPFDSNGEKIKESKLLIDKLDLPRSSDFFPSPEYDSFLFEDFFEVDALPSTNNEEKVFNLGILIQENLSEVITYVALFLGKRDNLSSVKYITPKNRLRTMECG